MAPRASPSASASWAPGGSLREHLVAASAIIGAPITVTDGTSWSVTSLGVQVGLGYFTALGHSEAEASALALLELWEHVRFPRMSPERMRRRNSIARQRPELTPLLDVVLRVQAAAELLTVMPAAHDALVTGASRSVPENSLEWPRHLQWVGVILAAGLARRGDAGPVMERAVDPAVAEEWWKLQSQSSSGADPLRRAFAPDPTRTPRLRLERSLALVLPAFERLRTLDLAERGLEAAGNDASSASSDEPANSSPDGDVVSGGDSGGRESEPSRQADGEASADAAIAPPDAVGDRARAGVGQDHAEGADLFAAEQAGFVRSVLATPMPADGAVFFDDFDLPDTVHASLDPAAVNRAPSSRSGGHAESAAGIDYRQRVTEFGAAIERMREVWSRVITERIALHRLPGRWADDAGETLRPESLAGAVAEAIAGVPRPNAFIQRQERARRTRRIGNTDYVLLVDRSASMQGVAASAAADAALIMIEALAGAERDVEHAEAKHGIDLDLDIRTALIVFDARAHAVKPMSRGLDDAVRHAMVSAIREPRGSTNDGLALREAARQLGLGNHGTNPAMRIPSRDGIVRRRIVIFISDGGSNDPNFAAHELRRLHEAGVRVVGIGIGSDEVVQRFAPTSRRVDDPRRLPEVLQELIEDDLA